MRGSTFHHRRLRLTEPSDRTSAATLHDPEGRALLMTRAAWEVRGLPVDAAAPCRLEDRRWLLQGLWHVQFFSPEARLSVLAFPGGMRAGPFVLSAAEAPRSMVVSPTELDHRLVERGLEPRAEAMSRLTELLFDQSTARVLRSLVGCQRCAR